MVVTDLVGVAQELQSDLQEVLWSALDLVGVGSFFRRFLLQFYGTDNERKVRSLVRAIGSSIPLKPAVRPYFRALHFQSNISTSYESLLSCTTQRTTKRQWADNTFCSGPTLSRCETMPNIPYDSPDQGIDSPRASSPFPDSASLQSSLIDQEAVTKIAALEDELALLRQQVSSMLSQMTVPKTQAAPPPPQSVPIPPPPPPPPSSIIPPPPPPPVAKNADKSLSQLIQEGKNSINKHTDSIEVKQNAKSDAVSMGDVLKGLNKVKLKRIARSPGGTPIRDKPRSPEPKDTSSIIAAALRKRFAQMHTPDRDKESDSEFQSPDANSVRRSRKDKFSPSHATNKPKLKSARDLRPAFRQLHKSPHSLPNAPFGQHMLKRRETLPSDSSPSPSSDKSDVSR